MRLTGCRGAAMLVSFLFWNVNGKPLEERIARLARANDVDVLMLAECNSEPEEVLAAVPAVDP